MYIVLYLFKVKPNYETQFIEGWKGLTNLTYKNNGSLGSRLHRKEDLNYIAYAQWPSKKSFENASGNLPKGAKKHRNNMRSACKSVDVIDTFEVVEDLLASTLYLKLGL